MRILAFILAALIMFPGQGFARVKISDDEVLEAQKIKRKRFFFSKEIDALNIIGKVKHIPENNKVIVPYFRVTFALGGKYLNSVGGVTTSTTKLMSKLSGVDQETMQQITDEMYDELLDQLRIAGYEVLDIAALDDSANFQALKRGEYPKVKKNQAIFTAKGLPYPGSVAVKAYMAHQDVDALMLKADYTVNFVVVNENQKKFNILRDKSDMDVGQGINVFGELSVITGKGPVTFQIQQPITSDIAFGAVENTTTKMDKVGDGVAMVAAWAGGRGLGNRSSTNRVEVEASPDKYKEAAEDALSEANETLVVYMAGSLAGEGGTQEASDEPEVVTK